MSFFATRLPWNSSLIKALSSPRINSRSSEAALKFGTSFSCQSHGTRKGIYQSIRPGIGIVYGNSYLIVGKLYLNCDTAICPMYQRGDLISLAAAVLGKTHPEGLAVMNDAERRMLSRNLKGLQFTVVHRGEKGSKRRFKVNPYKFFDLTVGYGAEQRGC
jgi:hypothetical protein